MTDDAAGPESGDLEPRVNAPQPSESGASESGANESVDTASVDTEADADEPQLSRREVTRDKARTLREEQRKKERRTRFLIQGGIGVVILAIIAVFAIVLTTSAPAPSAGPANMASDGILIGKNFEVTPTAGLTKGEAPIATVRDKKSSVVSIRIYLDYFCPVCNAFETANKKQLSSWLKSGAVTLEIHPIAVLDRSSLGTAYSTRAANAAACVANYSPNDFWAFSQELYVRQPAENTVGLSNSQLVGAVKTAGVSDVSKITKCINAERFKGWVGDATTRASNGPLPDSSVKTVSGTPTVIVDGQEYPVTSADVSSAAAFAAFVEQTAGSQFDSSTPPPTPSATPTPTATATN